MAVAAGGIASDRQRSARYRGADRRAGSPPGRPVSKGVAWVELALAAGSVATSSLLLVLARQLGLPLREASVVLSAAGTTLFVASGLCGLFRWRLVGEAATAYVGLALLLLGSTTATLTLMLLLTHGERGQPAMLRSGELFIRVAVLILLVRAARGPAVDSGLRPLRGFGCLLAGALGVDLVMHGTGGWLVDLGLALVTAGVGVLYVREGLRRRRAMFTRAGAAALLLAAAQMVAQLAGTVGSSNRPWLSATAAAIRAVAGLYVLVALGQDLDTALVRARRVPGRTDPWGAPMWSMLEGLLARNAPRVQRVD